MKPAVFSRSNLGLTTPPVRGALFALALPVLGEQLLNTLVGIVDTFLAGQISATATSAVGLGAYVSWLVSLLVMAVATGTTAIVARLTGAGDRAEAGCVANQSIGLAILLGAAVSAAMYFAAPLLVRCSNLAGASVPLAVDYLRINSLGYGMLCVTLVGCAALRGAGDTRTPMLVFAIINVINIAFSWGLVHGYGPLPECGVRGIVFGTVIAQVVGAAAIISVFARGRSGLRLNRRLLFPRRAYAHRILRTGLPAGADGAIIWTGHFIFLALISRLFDPPLNEVVMAAHVIAIRVEALTYLPAFAYGTAAATMIGQALGAGDQRRAKRAGYEALIQCGSIAFIMGAVYYFGAASIYAAMSADPLVHLAGVEPFRALALLQPCLVLSIVLVGGLRGAGDTRYPLFISLVGSIVIRVSLGWLCGIMLGWGLMGAWTGMFGDMIWRAATATLRFRSGRWLSIRV